MIFAVLHTPPKGSRFFHTYGIIIPVRTKNEPKAGSKSICLRLVWLLHFRQSCQRFSYIIIGWDIIGHQAVVELFVCIHIEVAGSGKTE